MFKEKMKAIRKKRGWTFKEFARKIDVDWTSLWNYENGRRTPHYEILAAMVRKAGVKPAELF